MNSARNNTYIFNFPKTFIPNEIEERYRPYLERMPGNTFVSALDYLNYSIQSINLPGPNYIPVDQNDFPGNTRRFRSSLPTQELYSKELNVTCKSLDGFINYWLALDLWMYWYELDGKTPYIPDPPGIQIFDGEGNIVMTVQLERMIFQSITDLDLDFSSNTVSFKTFTMTFIYNLIDFKINFD